MSVSLKKGNRVSLKKEDGTSLKNITLGLGWDTNRFDGADFDLDASAFMLTSNGKVKDENSFIFYNNPDDLAKSVHYTGDNRTGGGDGDDEQIIVDLTKVPEDIEKIAFTVTIDQYEERNQTFGMVDNAFIRIVDNDTGKEEVRYDLTEDYDRESAVVFGELYRHNGGWKFRAVGQGYNGGLAVLCESYGILVED